MTKHNHTHFQYNAKVIVNKSGGESDCLVEFVKKKKRIPFEFQVRRMSDSEDLDSDIEGGMELDAAAGGEAIDEDVLLNSDDDDDSDSSDGGLEGKNDNVDDDDDEEEEDDDDDDDEEDDESRLLSKYTEILGRIHDDKYNYDNYTELVDVAQ